MREEFVSGCPISLSISVLSEEKKVSEVLDIKDEYSPQ
jgi:hypothetical protein